MRRTFAILAGLALFLATAASAQAATSYAPGGAFANEAFTQPSRVAVDRTTGDVFVVVTGENLVRYYEPAGGTYVEAGTISGFSSPIGVAVDPTTGALYVADTYDNRIAKYASNGASPPVYSPDGSFTSPVAGSEPGQIGSFGSPIAVDPTNGDVIVADVGNQRVSRYGPDGTFISSFTGSDAAAGPFHSLQDIVAGGDGSLFVVDATTGNPPAFGGPSVVEHFAAGGSFLSEVGPVPTPRALAFDPGTGNLVVAGDSQVDFFGADTHQKLYVFHGGVPVDTIVLSPGATGAVPPVFGLAVDGSTSRLFALTGIEFTVGSVAVRWFDPVTVPTVSLDDVGGG